MSLSVPLVPSPNFGDRKPEIKLEYIVIHYTGMQTGDEALTRMCDAASEVSAHYMIEEDGHIIQLVDEGKRAWHAGQGAWRGVTDMNSASIGIELVNPGHQFGYRPFTAAQVESLVLLIKDIIVRYGMNPALCLLGHSDLAPLRKEDPGELFPWQELAKQELGLWPAPRAEDFEGTEHVMDAELQAMLRIVGYDCPQTGSYDPAMHKTILAFQRHFEPDNLTGTPERSTVARLRALVRQVNALQV
ncbi:MAG: N-acetylmuramoyl-L-alanine amidase [Alphaproteobacteria bacterium]|nr:N-acetylmuramoyl-L-alanine amidase [Alphaproteobacteria bacterium]MBV8548799.1 N-acetylmuramoyl-L-alanine amidase [Alphaproteobacteria bacterium]